MGQDSSLTEKHIFLLVLPSVAPTAAQDVMEVWALHSKDSCITHPSRCLLKPERDLAFQLALPLGFRLPKSIAEPAFSIKQNCVCCPWATHSLTAGAFLQPLAPRGKRGFAHRASARNRMATRGCVRRAQAPLPPLSKACDYLRPRAALAANTCLPLRR